MARPDASQRISEIHRPSDGDRLRSFAAEVCCPLLAAAVVIRGSALRFRSKAGELEVRAPVRFLEALYEWCDGTRTSAEIEALAEARWGPSRFGPFLQKMLASGVLADGSRLLDAAFDAIQLPSVLGRSADREIWEMGRTSAPDPGRPSTSSAQSLRVARTEALGRLIDARQSAPEFGGGGDVSERQLAALLDATYGLADGPLASLPALGRRSVASAGAFNSLRISLVLGRPAGNFVPGVYEVSYESAGHVGLRQVGPATTAWCRALLDAHRWLSASGLIVVSADASVAALKYKSRALHFALIETGAALQNAGLAAAELAIGLRILGGYYADRLARLCCLQNERVLGCAVFGPLAPARRADPASRRALRFDWKETGSDDSTYIGAAEVLGAHESGIGWGRSADARTACAIAVSEAVERYSFSLLGNCVAARACDLEGAVDPDSLVLYSPSQYRRADLDVHRFDPGKQYLWAPAMHWPSGRTAWVPAECVYSASALPKRFGSSALTRASSSGCATDALLEVAIERAAHEVIERDAVARHWLEQSAGTAVSAASWPADAASRLAGLEEQGCRVSVQILDRGLGPVVLVGIESEARGFSAIGTACGADALGSLERALAEATIVATVRLQQDQPAKINARDVRKPKDHTDLYSQRRHFRRARAVTRSDREEPWSVLESRWPRNLQERLEATGGARDMLWVDLTTSDAPLDPQGRELRTARVLIPGALPIAFGFDAIPRGRAVSAPAAARFPHPMA